jgi:Sulfotransferase family
MFGKLAKTTLNDLHYMLEYGKPKKKGTIYDLRSSNFATLRQPVFFLSTGRTGTKWFSVLLAHDKSNKILHNPTPSLGAQSNTVYKTICNSGSPEYNKLIEEIYLAARENHLRYSFKTDRRIIETNNYISFFAPILAKLFPESRFVHLVRHPVEFIWSGVRRQYYTNSPEDIRRIIPLADTENSEKWDSFSQTQKIAWLWNETNQFIENFKQTIDSERSITFPFHQLNTENVNTVLDFTGSTINKNTTKNYLNKRVNSQKTGNKSEHDDWKTENIGSITAICKDLSKKYGFII